MSDKKPTNEQITHRQTNRQADNEWGVNLNSLFSTKKPRSFKFQVINWGDSPHIVEVNGRLIVNIL